MGFAMGYHLIQNPEEWLMDGAKSLIKKKYEEAHSQNLALSQRIKQLVALQESSKAILS